MDIMLQRILSLIPKKPNGDFVHGEKKKFAVSIGFKSGEIVSDWIAGRSDSYKNYLYEISQKYDVSVEWLRGDTDRKPLVVPFGKSIFTGDEDLLSAATLASLAGEENKKPADQKASGLRGTGYELLNDENRAVIDALIEKLYKSQFGE